MKAPSGVAPEVLSLPKGGGAVRSIGDTFSPDLYSGSGSYQVPLWFPKGPGGFQPGMSLIYTSGSGTGRSAWGGSCLCSKSAAVRIAEFRPTTTPRTRSFWTGRKSSRWATCTGCTSRANFGARCAPAGACDGPEWPLFSFLALTPRHELKKSKDGVTRTSAWLIETATDRNGNQVRYSYVRDQGQLYLDAITYGPYEIKFLYEVRPGFSDRPARRVCGDHGLAVERHRIQAAAEAAPLFRSYALGYEECQFSKLSLLSSVVFHGYSLHRPARLPIHRSLFSSAYTPFTPKHAFKPISVPFGRPSSQLARATGVRPGRHARRRSSRGHPSGRLCAALLADWVGSGDRRARSGMAPAHFDLADRGTAFADMDGNGAADIVLLADSPLGYLSNEPQQGWSGRIRFQRAPTFDPGDPDIRLVDLNGDGLTDALRITSKMFYVYINRGGASWDAPFRIVRKHDMAVFPDVSFRDSRVKLADMTGDGLIDIVWVHGSRIDYWPNLGNGHFGARVSMALHPSVGPDFDPERLFLADVNGDGLSDVVYEEGGRVRFWINRSGRTLAEGGEVLYTPRTNASNARVADLLGTGTAGLVWSFAFSSRDPNNYKYLGFAGVTRPYLLNRIENGIGGITEIEYKPSTQQAVEAASRGTPWQSALPFPVQTVSGIVQRDAISGTVTTRTIRYYDGFFDGHEREFRGFGRAEVIEDGAADSPSTMTVSYFHQGRRGVTPGATREDRAALKGRLYRMEVFGPAGDGTLNVPFRREDDEYEVKQLAVGINGRRIIFPKIKSANVFSHQGQPASLADKTEVTYDDLGNIIRKDQTWDAGAGQQRVISHFRYSADTASWILNLPVELVETDGSGTLLRQHRYFYDGPAFTGLPLGEVTKGNLSRREELVLTEARAAAVYNAQAPNFAALGYHSAPVFVGGQGWAANSLRQSFDMRGNIISQMDEFGNAGQVFYDADGIFPTGVRNPLGHQFDSTYDMRAQAIVRISDPNGPQTEYRFDSSGRLRLMFKAGDSEAHPTVEFDYLEAAFPRGVRTRIRDQAGTLDSIEYFDGLGKRIQLRSAAEDGQVLSDGSRGYNRRGWEAVKAVPRLSTGFAYVPGEGLDDPQLYQFRHDALGRIIETTTPDGRLSRIVYELGLIRRFDVSDTDSSPENIARGHFDTPRIEEYDARGRLLAITETNTGGVLLETQYELDALGRIVSITDARGVKIARYFYDLVGRKIAVDHVDAGRRLAIYDARGDMSTRIDAAGQAVTMEYDELRRTAVTRVNAAVVERFTYDAGVGNNLIGRLAQVEDEAGEVRFSYTARGLLERKTRTVNMLAGPGDFSIDYTYDLMERLTSLMRPDGSTVDYTYNGRSLPNSIPGVVNQFRWNAHGQITEAQFASGVTEFYSFDAASFYMTGARVTGPARDEPYYDVTYAHDAVGNPLSIADNVAAAGHPVYSRNYTYDALYRLTGAQATLDGVSIARTYQYDEAGNFQHNDEFGAAQLFLEPGGSNRISGAGATQLFTYDPNGNMIGAPNQARTFDARGRLVTVQKNDGTTVSITYGYSGERVRKRVTTGAVTIETIYIDNVYEVRDGVARRYVVHQNRRIAEESGGATQFLHPDHLGNIVLITDTVGAIVKETGYLPFGTIAFTTGTSSSDHGFISREFDEEIGLVFCASRYYDPALGRFISPDPFLLLNPEKTLGNVGGFNLYVYAGNNPMRQVDDNGTWWKWLVGALIIVALVAATIVVGVLTGGAGFAFGILLAASIGSALGAGVGTFSAWSAGGSLEDGFPDGRDRRGSRGCGRFRCRRGGGCCGRFRCMGFDSCRCRGRCSGRCGQWCNHRLRRREGNRRGHPKTDGRRIPGGSGAGRARWLGEVQPECNLDRDRGRGVDWYCAGSRRSNRRADRTDLQHGPCDARDRPGRRQRHATDRLGHSISGALRRNRRLWSVGGLLPLGRHQGLDDRNVRWR